MLDQAGCLPLNICQNLFGMNFGFNLLRRKNLFDNAFLVYQVSGAQNANGLSATHHLFAPTTQFLQQGGFGVGNEWKLQTLDRKSVV